MTIGISGSLLIAYPLILINFIKTWSVHKSTDSSNLPLFYTQIIRKSILSNMSNALYDYPYYETVLFKLPSANTKKFSMAMHDGRSESSHVDSLEVLASLCYDKAKHNSAGETSAVFSLFCSDEKGSRNVSLCLTAEDIRGLPEEQIEICQGLAATNWDAFGPYEVDFQGNNKPVQVSYLMEPFHGEGAVIIMGSGDDSASDRFIGVAVPQKKI